MANLLMHCGGRHVSRDDIVNAPTPRRTRTWVPVPHHRLLDLVETTIDGQGYRVTSQAHGNDDANRQQMALGHEELAEVITAWPLLSADLRRAILAIVRSADVMAEASCAATD